jgi:hypothetical protein
MPTAEKPYPIAVKLSGGTAKVGWIHIKNGRTRDYRKMQTNSSYEVVTDLTKLTDDGTNSGTHTNYATNDVILIEASGNRTGSTTHTVLAKGGGSTIKLSCTDVSTTNAPAVNI